MSIIFGICDIWYVTFHMKSSNCVIAIKTTRYEIFKLNFILLWYKYVNHMMAFIPSSRNHMIKRSYDELPETVLDIHPILARFYFIIVNSINKRLSKMSVLSSFIRPFHPLRKLTGRGLISIDQGQIEFVRVMTSGLLIVNESLE